MKSAKTLPEKPGVYKMIDKDGKVIYVGKAKNLKKRVSQYFQKSSNTSVRIQKLIENIADIKYIVVDSELEALILELNLIKELHPKYNIMMRDDKNYVYIKITDEDFPRVQIVRKIDDKTSTYFGPKTAAHKVEKTFKTLKKVFPFRHCSLDIKSISATKTEVTRKTIKYPCLDHYIKRCAAPCIPNCTKEQYAEIINNVKRFLEGHHDEIIKSLYKQMEALALEKNFEKAAKLRDRIKNVEEITERQKVSDPNQTDKDIINYVVANEKAFFNLFQIRGGKLINQENFILSAKSVTADDDKAKEDLLEAFLTQYYEKTMNIPKEILIPHKPSDKKSLETFIKAKLLIPQRGQKNKLLTLSLKNAKVYAERNQASWQDTTQNSSTDTPKIPKRIECYDISHLAGTSTVGSMVVLENGIPNKNMYRKFKLRTVKEKPDDYKSLEEVLTRRLSYLSEIKDEYAIKKYKQSYLLKKKKKIVGLIAEKVEKNTHILYSLWVSDKERGKKLGHRLLRHAINKSKGKRVYIDCKEELVSYYEQIGFQKIKTPPKGFKKGIWLVYDKAKNKDKSFTAKPSLIIIDGGKGQLNVAIKVLKKFALNIEVMSIAKKQEEIFVPNKTTPIKLDKTSPTLKLIQHSRDEAHRFAINYNIKLRKKKMME